MGRKSAKWPSWKFGKYNSLKRGANVDGRKMTLPTYYTQKTISQIAGTRQIESIAIEYSPTLAAIAKNLCDLHILSEGKGAKPCQRPVEKSQQSCKSPTTVGSGSKTVSIS